MRCEISLLPKFGYGINILPSIALLFRRAGLPSHCVPQTKSFPNTSGFVLSPHCQIPSLLLRNSSSVYCEGSLSNGELVTRFVPRVFILTMKYFIRVILKKMKKKNWIFFVNCYKSTINRLFCFLTIIIEKKVYNWQSVYKMDPCSSGQGVELRIGRSRVQSLVKW